MHDFDLLDDTKNLKLLYKETPIWTASLFGGPFAAAYMVAYNFKQESKPEYVQKTWLFAGLLFILNILVMYLPIAFVFIPMLAPHVVNIAITNLLLNKFQVDFIDKHQSNGGRFKPASAAWGPCLLGFFFYVVPMITIYILIVFKGYY